MGAVELINGVRTTPDEGLRQLCPYTVYANTWPPDLEQHLRKYFSLLTVALHRHRLASITTVVATQYGPCGREASSPHSVRLYTFGRFRKPYSAMTQMATALADLYREFPILPVIVPVFAKDWEVQRDGDGPLYQTISRFGLLCYSALERDAGSENPR
jgi:hypothetical protein